MLTNSEINCNISSCSWYGEIESVGEHFQKYHQTQIKEIKYNQHVDFHFDDIRSNDSFLLYDTDKCYWLKFQNTENSIKGGIYNVGERYVPESFYIKFGCYRENGCAEYYGPFTTKPEHSTEYDLELSNDALQKFKKTLSPKIMIYFVVRNETLKSDSERNKIVYDNDYSDSSSSDSYIQKTEESKYACILTTDSEFDADNEQSSVSDQEQNGNNNESFDFLQNISNNSENQTISDVAYNMEQNGYTRGTYENENDNGNSILEARTYLQANLLIQRKYFAL